jgi:hypothetical protein
MFQSNLLIGANQLDDGSIQMLRLNPNNAKVEGMVFEGLDVSGAHELSPDKMGRDNRDNRVKVSESNFQTRRCYNRTRNISYLPGKTLLKLTKEQVDFITGDDLNESD